jgi:ribosomal protein S6
MNKYELTVVLDAKSSAAKKKKIEETVSKMIAVFKGKMGKLEDWGVKEAGAFMHFPLELEPQAAKEIKIKLGQEKEILKYLLIRKE